MADGERRKRLGMLEHARAPLGEPGTRFHIGSDLVWGDSRGEPPRGEARLLEDTPELVAPVGVVRANLGRTRAGRHRADDKIQAGLQQAGKDRSTGHGDVRPTGQMELSEGNARARSSGGRWKNGTLAGSELRVDLVHRNRLERRNVDPALLDNRRDPPRRASDAAPSVVRVLRIAVLGRALLALEPVRGAVAELGEDVAQLVAVSGDAALELAPEVLPALLLARCHLGLGFSDEVGQLVDVEAGKFDGCHGGGPRGE